MGRGQGTSKWTSLPKLIWEELVATPHGRECTRPLHALAVQCPLQTSPDTQPWVRYMFDLQINWLIECFWTVVSWIVSMKDKLQIPILQEQKLDAKGTIAAYWEKELSLSMRWDFSGQRWEWSDRCVALRYKIEFQVKSWERDYPTCIWRPHWRCRHSNFAETSGTIGYHVALFPWFYI